MTMNNGRDNNFIYSFDLITFIEKLFFFFLILNQINFKSCRIFSNAMKVIKKKKKCQNKILFFQFTKKITLNDPV